MDKPTQRIIWLALTAIYMAAIVISSLQPAKVFGRHTASKEIFLNVLHIPAYALLMYMLVRCWLVANRRVLILAFVIAVVFGALNECIQALVPGRTASVNDALMNVIGAGVILIVLTRMSPCHQSPRHKNG